MGRDCGGVDRDAAAVGVKRERFDGASVLDDSGEHVDVNLP